MNREAALLGVPTYSFFTGTLGGVDRELQRRGKMKFVTSPEDVQSIQFVKRSRHLYSSYESPLADELTQEIERVLYE